VKTIVIIGGGLGGLALCHGLRAAGLEAQVFERDPGPATRAQGFRISLSPDGLKALEALLSPARFAALDASEVRGVGRGFTFASAGLRPLVKLDGEAGRTVQRPALRQLLADGLPVEWGKRLVTLDEPVGGEGPVRARFQDGSTAMADLVIGCDGAGSEVRAAMRAALGPAAGLPERASAGVGSVGGWVPRTPDWDARLPANRGGAAMYLGPRGRCLFVSFCEREDRSPVVLWALSRPDPDDEARAWRALGETESGRQALRALCVAELGDERWHPALRALVVETPGAAMVEPLQLWTTRFPPRPGAGPLWPSGRVTLLGDAAHTMPPQRGLGGNTAFIDAAALAGALPQVRQGGERRLRAVIAAYERGLLARGRQAVEASEEALRLCHLRHPAAVVVRGAALRLVGAGLAVRRALAASGAVPAQQP